VKYPAHRAGYFTFLFYLPRNDAFAKSRFCSIREHFGRTKDVSRFSGTKTRYNALKQLAFLNAEHLKRFSPEMLKQHNQPYPPQVDLI